MYNIYLPFELLHNIRVYVHFLVGAYCDVDDILTVIILYTFLYLF